MHKQGNNGIHVAAIEFVQSLIHIGLVYRNSRNN
jgi:hypothetical protein